jgi:hypothetical protein
MTAKKYFEKYKWSQPQRAIRPLCNVDCDSGDACGKCPVWKELSENKEYLKEGGVEIPTMGGRADNLLFCYDTKSDEVRVWRDEARPNFKFAKKDCHALCRRYRQGLNDGSLLPPTELGGTAYFTDPKWKNPILGRRRTPYAAAVIRHIWIALNLPSH